MKKINFEITDINFDDKFYQCLTTNAEIEIKVNNKYTIPVNSIKVNGVDEDTFADVLMSEYGLDEDTAYETMWDVKYEDVYQTVSKEYAIEYIYELITEEWINGIIKNLADRDILNKYVA